MSFDPQAILKTPEYIELDKIAVTQFRDNDARCFDPVVMPLDNLKVLFDRGLLTATVRKERGGRGSNVRSEDPSVFLQALRVIARGSPGTAHCMQVQNHTAWMIDAVGTETQAERFLKPMTEKMFLCSLVGSEAARKHQYLLGTKAKKVDGGYVVNGAKNYATNGCELGLAVIFATIDGEDDFLKGHLMVVIEPQMEGVSVNHDWYRPTGMRVCPSPEIYLDNVFIPDSHVIGEPGTFTRDRWQGRFHLGFTANYVGVMEGMYGWVVKSLRERGKSKDPLVQLRVGETQTLIYGAQIAFESAIKAWVEQDVISAELASIKAKSICAAAANKVSENLVHLAGSTALFDQFPLGRLVRDLDTHLLHANHDRSAQIVGSAELNEQFDSTLQR